MSRGKQREPFEGARRSGEVDEALKLTHKLTAVDEADAIETAKGLPAVDWSIDDDLVIELPGAVAPVLAVTPEIELDHKDLVGYKVELDHKDVIGLDDQVGSGVDLVDDVGIKFDGLADDVGIIGPIDDIGIIGPIDDIGIKFDGLAGGVAFDVKGEVDFDVAPVFEEFDSQWSAGAESALREMSSGLDELVDLADPIDLQGFDG